MKKTIRRFATFSAAALATSLLFSASASATVLTSKLNVDNGFEVYISTSDSVEGDLFGAAYDWNNTYTNTTNLVAGTDYYLHVHAYDGGGVAGMLGEFTLAGSDHHFANGLGTLLTGTNNWLGNDTGFSGSYSAVNAYGQNGIGPWGELADISSDAQWIWSGNADSNDSSYFTAKILADVPAPSAVPEPASLALLGLGLLGIATLRRKK
jgi:hypothetical protein